MKNLILFIVLGFSLLASCKKDALPPLSDCAEQFIKNNQLVRYDVRALSCQFFYELYEFERTQYFVAGCHCADMTPNILDCENIIYAEFDSEKYYHFFKKATPKGIIAFRD